VPCSHLDTVTWGRSPGVGPVNWSPGGSHGGGPLVVTKNGSPALVTWIVLLECPLVGCDWGSSRFGVVG
jgi:hypothetical protein